jgi:hypothetical protein
MDRNAEKPTINVELFADFFSEEEVQAIREQLEGQFQVDGPILFAPYIEEEVAEIVYASVDIILSPATRDIVLGLASSALYDALRYIAARAKRVERVFPSETKAKFRISLKNESGHSHLDVEGDTNDPEVLKALLQQVSDAARETTDD